MTTKQIYIVNDVSKIRVHLPCQRKEDYLKNPVFIERITKAGFLRCWFGGYTQEFFSIPKKHLHRLQTKLSRYGLSTAEIDLFRQLRLVFNGYYSESFTLQQLDFYNDNLLKGLQKLNCTCKASTTLTEVRKQLPFYSYLECC